MVENFPSQIFDVWLILIQVIIHEVNDFGFIIES